MKIVLITSGKGGVGKDYVLKGISKNMPEHVVIDLDTTTSNLDPVELGCWFVSPPRGFASKRSIKSYINTSIKFAKRKDVDYILINTPPTLSDTMTAVIEAIDNVNIVFVTTPSKESKQDTLRSINYFKINGNVNIVGLVQNMVGKDFGKKFNSVAEWNISTLETFRLSDKNYLTKFCHK